MSGESYELLSYIARYWFSLLAALVVWRAWRAVVRDNRKEKLLRAWEGGAGCVGEMVLVDDGSKRRRAQPPRFLVPQEAVIGSGAKADIRLRGPGIRRRHVYMTYRPGEMALHAARGAEIEARTDENGDTVLRDGDKLKIGRYTLMMVFFDAEDARPARKRAAKPKQPRERTAPEDEFDDVWE